MCRSIDINLIHACLFFSVMYLNPPIQSVLGKMNEIAKHKAAIEDADTQNKVSNHCTFISAH